MLKAEIKKIISFQTFWLVLVLFLFVNFYFKMDKINNRYYTPAEYKSYISQLNGMTLQEIIDYSNLKIKQKNSTETFEYTGFILYDMLEITEQLIKYPEYLESIENNSDTLKSSMIWGDDNTFSYRNIKKTSSAYLRLKGTELTLDTSLGIEDFFHSPITDVLGIFLLFMCSCRIFIYDRERKVINLLNTTYNGRQKLIITKLFTGILFSILIVVSLYFENLLIGWRAYGLGDLSRPIQCIYGYYTCNLNLSTKDFIIVFILMKILSYCTVYFVFSLISLKCTNNISVLLFSASYIIIEFFLYHSISEVSSLNLLHFLNSINFLNTDYILKNYININLFGYPYSLKISSLAAMIFTSVIVLSIMICSCKKDIIQYQKKSIIFFDFFKSKIHTKFGYTLYRIFIIQKGIVIALTLSMISAGLYQSFSRGYDNDDIYYENFCNKFSGPVTESTLDFITEKEIKYKETEIQLSELKSSGYANPSELIILYSELLDKQAFEKFKNRINLISTDSEIFYDSGYERYFKSNLNTEGWLQILFILTALMLTVCPIPYIDCKSDIKKILFATSSGKTDYYKQQFSSVLLIGVSYTLLITIPYFIRIINKYGTQGLTANISSLTTYSDTNVDISVFSAMCIFIIIRMLLSVLSGCIMMIIASYNKNIITTYCINSTLFIVPIIILIIFDKFAV